MKRAGFLGAAGRLAMALALCAPAIGLIARPTDAQSGITNNRGIVAMKGLSVHGGSPQGTGQVIPNGGYYMAANVSATVSIKNVNLIGIPDGTPVYITLEYLDLSLPPTVIGSITLSGGGGSFATGNNPAPVEWSSKINTMSVRTADGTIIMTGAIKSL